MTLKTITDIADVRPGDVAYFHHLCGGYEVLSVDLISHISARLLVTIPPDFPIHGVKANAWLWDDGFDHATREIPDKKLPTVTSGHPQAFFTQSGKVVYYDGEFISPWRVWNDEQDSNECCGAGALKNHLPASEFPLLNAVPGEVAE